MAEAKIYEAIASCMADIGAVGKGQKNLQQGFMYRGIDAVMNALAPAMQKNKIFVTPEVLEQTREERTTNKGGTLIYSICKIRYTFYTVDGSSVQATVIGEGMDSGDKATNKAMSIAFKYACFQVFCIPTEEMVDPDAEVHEVKPKTAKKAAAPAPAPIDKAVPAPEAPSWPDVVKLLIGAEIPEDWIRGKYKVPSGAEFPEKYRTNIIKNIDALKKMFHEEQQKQKEETK